MQFYIKKCPLLMSVASVLSPPGFQVYIACDKKTKLRCLFCFYVFQKFYSQTLVFQISQSAQKLMLLAQGQGLEPRLEFSPSVLELGPLLPYAPGDEGEVVVKNPCSFPIEFYSLEFDQQYLLEEKVSRGQNQISFSSPCWALPCTGDFPWCGQHPPDLCHFLVI